VVGGGFDVRVIVACAAGLCVVGIVDDRVHLGPLVRVLAEFAAAFALWQADLGWLLFDEGMMNLALTTLWVVGIVNAFNLMDNLDGAAGTVGGVSAIGVGVLAATQGETAIAATAFALAGACAGFLRFNLARPSRVFLGDGGSMPLGFVLAASVTAIPATEGFGTAAVFAVVPLVGLAVLDTTLVVVSRVRRGVGVLTGGRDHLTHRLLTLLGSPQMVALTLAGAQATLCLLGFLLFDSTIVTVFSAATAYVLLGAATIAALEWPYMRAEARAAAEAALSPALAPAQQESRS
jgi:UDP-GlcNAc:undecaprenyl-phosphate/decaprenyl-phosphate GlcNAc-1-phosphate transferase